jgi:hypothetical protein
MPIPLQRTKINERVVPENLAINIRSNPRNISRGGMPERTMGPAPCGMNKGVTTSQPTTSRRKRRETIVSNVKVHTSFFHVLSSKPYQ